MSKPCRYCQSQDHPSMACWKRPRKPLGKAKKPMRWRSRKAEVKYGELHKAWHKANPPDGDHKWLCWLQISPDCSTTVNYKQLTLEHVYPRAKFKELEYVVLNIKPSCRPCNKAKLSNTPQQLALMFPNILSLISTPEWKLYEQQLIPFSSRLSLYLGYTDKV